MRYVILGDIHANLDVFQLDTKFCLVGHSHVPLIFQQNKDGNCFAAEIPGTINLGCENHRLIINPGGVGQPCDGDPRVSDARIMYHYRVNYDITVTQKKMMEYKLPLALVFRLNYGY